MFYRLEAVHLGDLLRIWVRSGAKIKFSPSDFQGPAGALRTPQEPRCFTETTSLSPGEPIPGSPFLTKKRQLFPGLPPTSPSSFALPHWIHEGSISASGFGNINPIPFRSFGGGFSLFTHTPQFGTGFPYSLGPTDPCSTAVHMEPFSTSVLKVLTRVFATTTKICASGGSRRAYARHLRRSPLRPSYSPGLLRAAHEELRLCPGGRVWARRWSAIHFQG